MIVLSGWEELADWYDKKQGETGDLWHRALIDPGILKVIGNVQGLEILDLGCGNGYLARKFARDGAKVTAVDASQRMIENAIAHDPKNTLSVKYVQSDANRLKGIQDSGFDLVYANMSLMDIEDTQSAVREVGRVLKNRGRFVASICHPCFDTGSQSGWVMDKPAFEPPRVFRKVRAYRTPSSEKIPWRLENGERAYTTGFNRPLNWYARVFRENGLLISAMEEPLPSDEFLAGEREKGGDIDAKGFLEVPLHLVFEAVKI